MSENTQTHEVEEPRPERPVYPTRTYPISWESALELWAILKSGAALKKAYFTGQSQGTDTAWVLHRAVLDAIDEFFTGDRKAMRDLVRWVFAEAGIKRVAEYPWMRPGETRITALVRNGWTLLAFAGSVEPPLAVWASFVRAFDDWSKGKGPRLEISIPSPFEDEEGGLAYDPEFQAKAKERTERFWKLYNAQDWEALNKEFPPKGSIQEEEKK